MKYALSCLMVLLTCGSTLAGDLFIVAAVNGGMPRKEKVIFLKKGDTLQLHAIRRTAKGYSGFVPAFEEKGRVRHVSMQGYRRPPGWLRIEPVVGEYNNLRNGGSVVPIRYRAKEAISGDVLSFPAKGEEGAFGTRYFAIEGAGVAGEEFEETVPLHEKYPFRVVQVIYRADDTYLGYLTELFGTPFVIAPKIANGFHQVESRIGCDCASFAVYGKRRQGNRVTYDGPRGIYKNLEELLSGPLYHQPYGETEAYVEENGKAISTGNIQSGDIIHFGEQVSVFYRDAGIPGVLDRDDELMQCFGSTPVITTFAKSGFYGKPIRVFRWRESGK